MILAKGQKVFLDLKFHDIPNTVAKAGEEATKHNVTMFNLHALGGFEMMKKTVGGLTEPSPKHWDPKTSYSGGHHPDQHG